MVDIKGNVKYIKGVGEARAKVLNRLGIFSVYDLITYFPRGYDDRSVIKKIVDIEDGERCTFKATLVSSVNMRMLGRYKSIAKATISDGTDNIQVIWFNQPYIAKNIQKGEVYKFYRKSRHKKWR